MSEPRKPEIALRPDKEHGPHNAALVPLDDVVVTGCTMFRAEFMDDNELWLRCYLNNDESIDFSVSTKRAPIRMVATDLPKPGTYEDWDANYSAHFAKIKWPAASLTEKGPEAPE